MTLRIDYRPYHRDFVSPLRTANGEWAVREGFIVRFEQYGSVGYGEIAPLPEFGTETIEASGAFLRQLTHGQKLILPANLPCCAFGLSAASGDLRGRPPSSGRGLETAALLPAGFPAVNCAQHKVSKGYTTLKWKIGVEDLTAEKLIFKQLVAAMPDGVKLRLDANAGLNVHQLEAWLDTVAEHSDRIEFLEQPLPPGEERIMAELSKASAIPIALDESLNGEEATQWLEPGVWHGPLVIKPLLMGDVALLQKRLHPLAQQLVYSSVFETAIGLANAFALIDALPESKYALGFDTLDAFDDALSPTKYIHKFEISDIARLDLETIWKQLAHST